MSKKFGMLASLCLATLLVASASITHAVTLSIASKAQDGAPGDGESNSASISANGSFTTFTSTSLNLVENNPSDGSFNFPDCFIKENKTGYVEMINFSTEGIEGNSWCYESASDDSGRFVVFTSLADNLVAGDTNNAPDVFLRDRVLKTTTKISNGEAVVSRPFISADGSVVTYVSRSYNPISDKLIVYDVNGGTYSNIYTSSNDRYITKLYVSRNGRFIVFYNNYDVNIYSLNPVFPFGSNGVFVYDRELQELKGYPSSYIELSSSTAVVSEDGRYVVTVGTSDAQVPHVPIYVYDNVLMTVTRITDSMIDGSQNINPSISGDGRFIVFENTVPYSWDNDIYVYDQQNGSLSTVAHGTEGKLDGSGRVDLTISENGRYLQYTTNYDEIVPSDNNGKRDVVIADLAVDNDNDGYGNFYNIEIDDCDDNNATINPGAVEQTNNGIDENCNGNEDDIDVDFDNFGATIDCNDLDGTIYPGAEEVCDGVDNNCDTQVDEGFDLDGDNFTVCQADCDDTDSSRYPGATETKHDGIDQSCNGYDLTIDVSASYKANKNLLNVNATSDLGPSADLYLNGFGPMQYDGNNRWSIAVNNVGGMPVSVTVSGVEGSETYNLK